MNLESQHEDKDAVLLDKEKKCLRLFGMIAFREFFRLPVSRGEYDLRKHLLERYGKEYFDEYCIPQLEK